VADRPKPPSSLTRDTFLQGPGRAVTPRRLRSGRPREGPAAARTGHPIRFPFEAPLHSKRRPSSCTLACAPEARWALCAPVAPPARATPSKKAPPSTSTPPRRAEQPAPWPNPQQAARSLRREPPSPRLGLEDLSPRPWKSGNPLFAGIRARGRAVSQLPHAPPSATWRGPRVRERRGWGPWRAFGLPASRRPASNNPRIPGVRRPPTGPSPGKGGEQHPPGSSTPAATTCTPNP